VAYAKITVRSSTPVLSLLFNQRVVLTSFVRLIVNMLVNMLFSFAILIITKHKRYLDVIYIYIFDYFLIFIN